MFGIPTILDNLTYSMSSVVIQVGQCGNQVGTEFWNVVRNDKDCELGRVYSHQEGYLRSVNIDSEPKVLHRLTQSAKISLRPANILKGRRGRGTNWALGYYGTKDTQEDQLLETSIDVIRREIERCSCFSGFFMLHSISGGTGSGLGSRLCERLRDEFTMHQMVSCVVAPHEGGESPLQHYNSLLCLAWLQRYSDAVLFFRNDEVMKRLERQTKVKDTDSQSGVTFTAMNQHIAKCCAGIVLPTDTITPHSGVSIGQELWEMIRTVAPLPANKFIQVNYANKSKQSWENLTGAVTSALSRYDSSDKPYSSLANLLVARGDATGTFAHHWSKVEAKVKVAYHPVSWNPFPVTYWSAYQNTLGPRDSSSVTIASNHSSIGDHLTHIADRARLKYQAGAYLHWYHKYGCHNTDFEEAFETIDSVVEAYTDAVS